MFDFEFVFWHLFSAQLLSEFGNNQRGAGILHSIWESDNQVLSCGYDSCVRLWDTRSTQNW
jgi:WD40 repeat protein